MPNHTIHPTVDSFKMPKAIACLWNVQKLRQLTCYLYYQAMTSHNTNFTLEKEIKSWKTHSKTFIYTQTDHQPQLSAQDGIWATKNTSMLPSKIHWMKVSQQTECGRIIGFSFRIALFPYYAWEGIVFQLLDAA